MAKTDPNFGVIPARILRAVNVGDIRWEDLRVPVTATTRGGSKDPAFDRFKRDLPGTSQGVFVYWFDKTAEEELYFVVQFPHAMKIGTPVNPHFHWVPKTNGGAGKVVGWGLEYTWANIGEVFGVTSMSYANAHYPPDASLVAGKHYLTSLPEIAKPTGNISSMMSCRLFRDATGSGVTDDYDDDVGLMEFDFHYQIDDRGSVLEGSKN